MPNRAKTIKVLERMAQENKNNDIRGYTHICGVYN